MAKPFLHCHRRFKNGKDHCYWSIAEKVRTRPRVHPIGALADWLRT